MNVTDKSTGYIFDVSVEDSSVEYKMYRALQMCLEALYEAVEIAPLDKLPTKAPMAMQQAQYVLNQVDGGNR